MKKSALVVVLLTLLSQTAFAQFSDIGPNTNYRDAILWLNENGVIQGYPDGTFKPEVCVNRVELLKMIYLTNETNITDMSIGYGTGGYFSDVDMGQWYWPYLRYALDTGTVVGYPDKTFKPDQCVKRVEAMKMATLEFNNGQIPSNGGYSGQSFLIDSYKDIDHSAWYFDYFVYTISANVVGLEHVIKQYNPLSSYYENDQYFGPGTDMARKEVSEMLYRMKAIKDKSLAKYTNEVPNPIITQ
jgi:hypothetical protein